MDCLNETVHMSKYLLSWKGRYLLQLFLLGCFTFNVSVAGFQTSTSMKCDIAFAVKEKNLPDLQQQLCPKVLQANGSLGAAILGLCWFIQPNVLPSLESGTQDPKGGAKPHASGGVLFCRSSASDFPESLLAVQQMTGLNILFAIYDPICEISSSNFCLW